jgi:predicted metalloprotease with PDZ domain
MRAVLALCAVLCANAAAQENRDDLTPYEITYTTRVTEKRFEIEIAVENVNRPTLHIAMPNWTPGAYGIGNYGERVEDFKAEGEGGNLEVERMDVNRWSIATAGSKSVRVSYSLDATRRGRFGGRAPRAGDEDAPVTGLRLDGPRTYPYVVGAKDLPVTARYVLPDGWRVANGLLPTSQPDTRRARDYDTFIDAPTIFGEFEERHFDVAGTPFTCVFFDNTQKYAFDIDAFVDIVEKIVTNIGQLYGSFPFPNYVFLFSIPGGGGLEHLNSTSIGLSAERQAEDPEAGASVTAHEFFHAWNVKRIRPEVLGPFDYQQENYTGNLWVSEGWTSYFGDLTLVRIGVLDHDEYLSHLRGIIATEQNKARRKEHSVMWASRNVWHRSADEEGPRVDYYGKGELLAALIDLKIRHETKNEKNLNDVMRFMNRWFAERDVGFEENDVERACTAISNHDFGEFFARHVSGTMDPPLAEYLAYAGIEYTEETIPCSFPFNERRGRISGNMGRRPETPPAQVVEAAAADDGGQVQEPEPPQPGETIVLVDGEKFENAEAVLRRHAPGDVVRLTLERDGEQREVDVKLTDTTRMIPAMKWMEDASELQRTIRADWLGSVH